MDLQARRRRRRGAPGGAPIRLGESGNSAEGGTFALSHGHSATWLEQPEPEKRPIYPALAEIRARVASSVPNGC